LPGVLTSRMATSVNQVVSPVSVTATTSYERRPATTPRQIDNERTPSIPVEDSSDK
jgi:hypothetical protein